MENTLSLDIVQEIRLLARRAFDLADGVTSDAAPSAGRLCRLVGQLLRRVRRNPLGGADDRSVSVAFKLVSDAVALLDCLAQESPDTAVEASALAAEATDVADRLFDMVEARALTV
jgi:hypothetical protein